MNGPKAKHNWQALQKHIDYIHPESGEKKYFCEHCDKGYIFEPTLYYHKWSRHNGDQKHMCDICGKEYNNKAGYTQHMLLQHNTNEAANLMCEQCAFSTPSKEMLKRHIKVIFKGYWELFGLWVCGTLEFLGHQVLVTFFLYINFYNFSTFTNNVGQIWFPFRKLILEKNICMLKAAILNHFLTI